MRFLFIHNNFPAQFRDLAPALAAAGHEVKAMRCGNDVPANWRGVEVMGYQPMRGTTVGVHPWVGDIETKGQDRGRK
jgi:hypothetical protein